MHSHVHLDRTNNVVVQNADMQCTQVYLEICLCLKISAKHMQQSHCVEIFCENFGVMIILDVSQCHSFVFGNLHNISRLFEH